jgi:hypothetical protein
VRLGYPDDTEPREIELVLSPVVLEGVTHAQVPTWVRGGAAAVGLNPSGHCPCHEREDEKD